MNEHRSTSRHMHRKFKTSEDNEKILQVPERERKEKSHTWDEESQSFQTFHQQH